MQASWPLWGHLDLELLQILQSSGLFSFQLVDRVIEYHISSQGLQHLQNSNHAHKVYMHGTDLTVNNVLTKIGVDLTFDCCNDWEATAWNLAIIIARKEHTPFLQLEQVGKIWLIALCSDKGKELTLLLISYGHTVLNLKYDWLVEPPGCWYSIDSTNQLSAIWELKLSSNNGLDSDVTGTRGSILRYLHPEAILLPLQQLRTSSTDKEQLLTSNMDTTKVICKVLGIQLLTSTMQSTQGCLHNARPSRSTVRRQNHNLALPLNFSAKESLATI